MLVVLVAVGAGVDEGGSAEAVSKTVMQKPQGKRRRRETVKTRVEAAQRPKSWVRIEKIQAQ
jgi:hypothetical protein